MTTEIITLLANLALALSFIVGLVFGIAQVRAAARDRKERLTLETLRNFQTREFSELMNFVTNSDVPPTHKEWQKRPRYRANYGYAICTTNGIAGHSCS